MSKYGVQFEPSRGKGSHGIFHNGGAGYPVPMPNGRNTEVSDVYVRKLCKRFDVNEDEMRSHL